MANFHGLWKPFGQATTDALLQRQIATMTKTDMKNEVNAMVNTQHTRSKTEQATQVKYHTLPL